MAEVEIERLRKIIHQKDEDAQTLAYVIRDKEIECKELYEKTKMLEKALLDFKNNVDRKMSVWFISINYYFYLLIFLTYI